MGPVEPLRCVGAVIRNPEGQVFVQRRALEAAVYPGAWDIVGGHVLPAESDAEALAREVHEETGWTLRRVCELVADWEWTANGVVRYERDYIVLVSGDLCAPRLCESEHDRWAWIGADAIDILIEPTTGDRGLRDIVARTLDIGRGPAAPARYNFRNAVAAVRRATQTDAFRALTHVAARPGNQP